MNKRIMLFTPEFAEREIGFYQSIVKIGKLAKEYGQTIQHYGGLLTTQAVKQVFQNHQLHVEMQSTEFEDWETFFEIGQSCIHTDMIVLLNSRPGAVSYNSEIANLPSKIERAYTHLNKVIIYPKSFIDEGN